MDTTAEKVLSALQRFNLKEEKQGHYRCNSPFRPNSDSKSFVVAIEADGEHGAYHDHVADESGSLYAPAEKLGIALPERIPIADTKRAYTGLEDLCSRTRNPRRCIESGGLARNSQREPPCFRVSHTDGYTLALFRRRKAKL